MTGDEIDARLKSLADPQYRAFSAKIVRTEYQLLGVRTPDLKALARRIAADPGDYFDSATLKNYEQILLYGLVLGAGKLPTDELLDRLDALIPKMDNWAHVDQTVGAVKALGRAREQTLEHFLPLKDAGEFSRRFLVVLLKTYYLDEAYLDRVFDLLAEMQNDCYYVNMGIAWALSTALVRFYDRTLFRLRGGRFCAWVRNKAIQKAVESRRITPAQKDELRAEKVKA